MTAPKAPLAKTLRSWIAVAAVAALTAGCAVAPQAPNDATPTGRPPRRPWPQRRALPRQLSHPLPSNPRSPLQPQRQRQPTQRPRRPHHPRRPTHCGPRPVSTSTTPVHASTCGRACAPASRCPTLTTQLVRKWEQYYAERPDYVQRMTERGGRYLFHIVEELDKRGMPTELALLPFIESAFNPQAMSVARASGMWQFMPVHRTDFDLKQNVFRDDRRDVLASTRAALDYLQKLHAMFGDWHLALAAYNWGEGNVQRAMQRNREAGAADRLREPAHAGRDARLRAQAAGGEEHRRRARSLRPDAAGAGEPPVLPERADRARHRRRAGGAAGRHRTRGVPAAEPADEQAGDPGRRHAAGAAALRQRQRRSCATCRSTTGRWPPGRPGWRRRR